MHVQKKTEGWGWKLHFQSSCLSLFCLCSLFLCRDRLMETQHSGTHSSVLSWRTFFSVSPWAVSHRAAVPPCVHRPVLMPAPSLGDTAQAHCSFLWSLCNSGLKTLVQELAVADVTSTLPSEHFSFQCSSSGYQSCFSILLWISISTSLGHVSLLSCTVCVAPVHHWQETPGL